MVRDPTAGWPRQRGTRRPRPGAARSGGSSAHRTRRHRSARRASPRVVGSPAATVHPIPGPETPTDRARQRHPARTRPDDHQVASPARPAAHQHQLLTVTRNETVGTPPVPAPTPLQATPPLAVKIPLRCPGELIRRTVRPDRQSELMGILPSTAPTTTTGGRIECTTAGTPHPDRLPPDFDQGAGTAACGHERSQVVLIGYQSRQTAVASSASGPLR